MRGFDEGFLLTLQ